MEIGNGVLDTALTQREEEIQGLMHKSHTVGR